MPVPIKGENEEKTDFGKRESFSCLNMPIADFSAWVSSVFGVGVVYSNSLDGLLISVDFRESTLDEIMLLVARRYNVSMVRSGNSYFVGSGKSSDKFVVVRQFPGYSLDDVRGFLGLFSGDSNRVAVTSNGVATILVDGESINKVLRAIDDFLVLRPGRFVVRLVFVRRVHRVSGDIGFNLVGVGELQAIFDKLSVDGVGLVGSFGADVNAVVGVLDDNYCFNVLDGARVVFNMGSEYRYRRSNVSEYGYVTSRDAEVIKVGKQVSITLRASSGDSAILDYSISDSSVADSSGDYPVLDTVGYNGSARIVFNRPQFLGNYRSRVGRSRFRLFAFGGDSSSEDYLLFCSVAPVGG